MYAARGPRMRRAVCERSEEHLVSEPEIENRLGNLLERSSVLQRFELGHRVSTDALAADLRGVIAVFLLLDADRVVLNVVVVHASHEIPGFLRARTFGETVPVQITGQDLVNQIGGTKVL